MPWLEEEPITFTLTHELQSSEAKAVHSLSLIHILIKEGKVKKSAIDDAVRNILRIKFRLGLFDNPYVDEKRIEEL